MIFLYINWKELAESEIITEEALNFKWEHQNLASRDFPVGAVAKNPPANAGDTGSSPGLERSHMPWSN